MSEEKKQKKEEREEVVEEAETPEETATPAPTEENWEVKAVEYLDGWKRSQAEFENYKKRLMNEKAELGAHLTKAVVSDLIPILDNFHSAVTHVPEAEKGSPWVTGITYIEKQFEEVLSQYGVKPLEVNPGDEFDPTKHEALEHTEDKEKKEKHLIIEKVIQKGYMIGDKVVRAAKVTVK